MRQQRKLVIETGDSQLGTGAALMIDIMQTAHNPLLVLDSDLRVISANCSFYNFFKVTPEETAGKHIYDLGNRQWDIPKLRTLLEDIIPKNNLFEDYEVEHEFLSIGRKVMLLSARCINQKELTPPPPESQGGLFGN
ncbi:MAG: PAS domain-containing protein [Bacteroidales bacterium]|nr:PAS domain-containing protein [Bacteroidales bacterium]